MATQVDMLIGMIKSALSNLSDEEKAAVLTAINELIGSSDGGSGENSLRQAQSNTVSNVRIGDSGNFNFSPVQNDEGSVSSSSFSSHFISQDDIGETLDQIAKLKDAIAHNEEISFFLKKGATSQLVELEHQLQKDEPNASLISRTLSVLRDGLKGAVSVLSPLDKVISLVIKYWGIPIP